MIPEWTEAFGKLTLQDCIDYIYNLTFNRTYDGFIREKSVVEDNLDQQFPEVRFEESDPELDHAGDIDYLGWVGTKAFGIQIKSVTAKANFGNYSASERMKASFDNSYRYACWCDRRLDVRKLMSLNGAKLHLYSKKRVEPNRKMGHITILGKTPAEVEEMVQTIEAMIGEHQS